MRAAVGRRAPRRLLLLIVATAVLAGACGEDGPKVPPEGSREVRFESAGNLTLEGRLFGDGAVGVVLSHMLPADQRSWWEFAAKLADEGYMALTYDFRGYCPGGVGGCSEGERDVGRIWQDVEAAIGFLRSEGATTIVLMGASMGGTASLVVAAEPDVSVAAVVSLSSPVSIDGLAATPEVLARVTAAKLYLAGLSDATAAEAAEQMYARSPQPKRVEILTTGDHGTDLLEGSQSGIVQTMILGYLEQFAPA